MMTPAQIRTPRTARLTLTLTAALLPCSLLLACGEPAEIEGAAVAPAAEADIATTRSALCTDAGAADYSAPLLMKDVGGSVSATSPTASYGKKTCLSRYVVEATSTLGRPNLSASASWADVSLSAAECANGRIGLLVYGFDSLTNTWSQVGPQALASGVMTPSPFGGPGSCDVSVAVAVPNTFSKVRVAALAVLHSGSLSIPKKVTGTISAHF